VSSEKNYGSTLTLVAGGILGIGLVMTDVFKATQISFATFQQYSSMLRLQESDWLILFAAFDICLPCSHTSGMSNADGQ